MEIGEVENMWRVRYERLQRDQHSRFYRVVLKLPLYTFLLVVFLVAAYLAKEYLVDALQLWEDLKLAIVRKREEMLVVKTLEYARERDLKELESQLFPNPFLTWMGNFKEHDWYIELAEMFEAFKKDVGAIKPPVSWEERKQVLMYYWRHRSRELMLDLTAEVINECLFYVAPTMREWRLFRKHSRSMHGVPHQKKLLGYEGEALIEDPSYVKHHRLTLVVDPRMFTYFAKNAGVGPTVIHMVGSKIFFKLLEEYYEFVIWSHKSVLMGALRPLSRFYMLGPSQDHFHLWRESMNVDHNERYYKDLTYMNRDMSKVVLLDTNPRTWKMYPENTLLVKKYKGEDSHQKSLEMCEYILFLYNLAHYVIGDEGGDVRHIISPFNRKIGPQGKYKDTLSALVATRRQIQNRSYHPSELEWFSYFESMMVYLHKYEADWTAEPDIDAIDHFTDEYEPFDEESILYDDPHSESPVWEFSPEPFPVTKPFNGVGPAVRLIPNLGLKQLAQQELDNYEDVDPADFRVDINVEEEPLEEEGGEAEAKEKGK